jgi:hypothetical protein
LLLLLPLLLLLLNEVPTKKLSRPLVRARDCSMAPAAATAPAADWVQGVTLPLPVCPLRHGQLLLLPVVNPRTL